MIVPYAYANHPPTQHDCIENALWATNRQPHKFIGHNALFFLDHTHSYWPDYSNRSPQIQWQAMGAPKRSFGFSKKPLWIHFSLYNTSLDSHFIINQNMPITNIITLFHYQNDSLLQLWRTGYDYPFAERPLHDYGFSFLVTIPPKECHSFFMKLQSDDRLEARISVSSPEERARSIFEIRRPFFLFIGMLSGLFLLNFLIGLWTKSKVYLLFSALAFVNIVFQLHEKDILPRLLVFLMPNPHIPIHDTLTGLLVLISLQLVIVHTQVKINHPHWYIAVRIIQTLCVGLFILDPFFSDYYTIIGQVILAIMAFPIATFSYILWCKNNNGNILAVSSWLAFGTGAIVWLLQLNGNIPSNNLTEAAMPTGALLQSLLFCLGLAFELMQQFKYFKKLNTEQEQHNQNLQLRIKEQSASIHDKNKELAESNFRLTSSIHYAKRIVDGFNTRLENSLGSISDYFLVWKPRQQIGSVTCWSKSIGDGFLVVLADCPGTSIQGAFLSITVGASLDNAFYKQVSPNQIDLNVFIQNALEEIQSNFGFNELKHLDRNYLNMALCYWQPQTNTLSTVCFHKSIYVCEQNNVQRYKGTREPIGYREHSLETPVYTIQYLKLSPGDSIYLASDGVTQQCGGDKNMPFGHTRLQNVLQQIHSTPFTKQQQIIPEHLQKYQGNNEPQGDICLLGVKL
jgi:serine phosphatase RsbU (regulator of sigma subunit)